MLDLIGIALRHKNMRFSRLDGSMNLQKREEAVTSFRQDPGINIILISIGSGSVGQVSSPNKFDTSQVTNTPQTKPYCSLPRPPFRASVEPDG